MKHVLACLAIVMLTGCVEANEVAHQYADGIRADIQAPGQIARGLRARAALRQYLKAYPPETQAQATQQWLSEHPAEAADIRSAVAYGYVAPLRSGDGTSGGQKVYSASDAIRHGVQAVVH